MAVPCRSMFKHYWKVGLGCCFRFPLLAFHERVPHHTILAGQVSCRVDTSKRKKKDIDFQKKKRNKESTAKSRPTRKTEVKISNQQFAVRIQKGQNERCIYWCRIERHAVTIAISESRYRSLSSSFFTFYELINGCTHFICKQIDSL